MVDGLSFPHAPFFYPTERGLLDEVPSTLDPQAA